MKNSEEERNSAQTAKEEDKLFHSKKYETVFIFGIVGFIVGLLLEILGIVGEVGTILSLTGVFLSAFSILTDRQNVLIKETRKQTRILEELTKE